MFCKLSLILKGELLHSNKDTLGYILAIISRISLSLGKLVSPYFALNLCLSQGFANI